jgi:cation transport protein ChaC
MTDDPFRHHPELRPLIKPHEESFFYDFTAEKAREMSIHMGSPHDWILPEEVREKDRHDTLAQLRGDLWVFAYGSLIWDPGIPFAEVRRAFAPGHERRFILRDTQGGRGTPDAPGLMATLDVGTGCNGLVFRIAPEELEVATYKLWSRERIGEAYLSAFIPVETDQGPLTALAFLADYDADLTAPDLTHDEQVHLIATGEGILGTSREYVENLARHFETMGIPAPKLLRLLEDVRAYEG